MTLFDHPLSGNCHKVRLLLSMLKAEYTSTYVDVLGRKNRRDEFLAINPLGQVPVLIDSDNNIRDSQAILYYLARSLPGGKAWLPEQPAFAAHVQEWLAFAALEIANGLQLARVERLLPGHVEGVDLSRAQRKGGEVLGILDAHLKERSWLVGDAPSIAECACVPYVSMAPEGGLSLDDFTHVCRWLDRFAKLPGFITMPGMRGTRSIENFGNETLVREWVAERIGSEAT